MNGVELKTKTMNDRCYPRKVLIKVDPGTLSNKK